jgi:hypothetical protein
MRFTPPGGNPLSAPYCEYETKVRSCIPSRTLGTTQMNAIINQNATTTGENLHTLYVRKSYFEPFERIVRTDMRIRSMSLNLS